MERSGDRTHLCQSPTPTMNSLDLTLPTQKQTSEQEFKQPVTGGSQHHSPATLPKAIHKEPGRMLFQG